MQEGNGRTRGHSERWRQTLRVSFARKEIPSLSVRRKSFPALPRDGRSTKQQDRDIHNFAHYLFFFVQVSV